jgi:hypothetical protein
MLQQRDRKESREIKRESGDGGEREQPNASREPSHPKPKLMCKFKDKMTNKS